MNLDKYIQDGWEHKDWYANTRDQVIDLLGEEFGDKLLALLAITSPNSTVKGNTTLAIKALDQYVSGAEFSGFTKTVVANLERLASGEEPKGPKVSAFLRALLGDENAVVVDRWILRAFSFPHMTPKRLTIIKDTITALAKKYDSTPREIQAAIWFGIKKEQDVISRDDRPYEHHLMEKLDSLDEVFA